MTTNSPFSSPETLDVWSNTRSVLEHIKTVTIPSIYETLVDDYGFANDDYNNDYTYDNLHEIVDGLSEVFVHYKARMVANAFGVCPFEDSPVTGSRYNSWNEIAFEVIMHEFNTQYSEQVII